MWISLAPVLGIFLFVYAYVLICVTLWVLFRPGSTMTVLGVDPGRVAVLFEAAGFLGHHSDILQRTASPLLVDTAESCTAGPLIHPGVNLGFQTC